MIAKTNIGKSFKGALNYCIDKDGSSIIGTSFDLEGGEKRDFIRNMTEMASQWRGANSVDHTSLSFTQEDSLDDFQMMKIAEDYMRERGYSDNQFVAIKHTDTEHPHIHLVINRVCMSTNKAVSDKHVGYRNRTITNGLEKKYKLVESDSREKVSRGKFQVKDRNPKMATVKKEIKTALEKALMRGSDDFNRLERELSRSGVEMRLNSNKNGLYGVSFRKNGISVSGTKIGWKLKDIEKVFERIQKHKAAKASKPVKPSPPSVSPKHISREDDTMQRVEKGISFLKGVLGSSGTGGSVRKKKKKDDDQDQTREGRGMSI